MGKKGGWLYSVKKVLSPHPKEKKDQKFKSKKILSSENLTLEAEPSSPGGLNVGSVPPPPPPPLPLVKEEKLPEVAIEIVPNKHAHAAALATPKAAEMVQLTSTPRFEEKSKEETAAIKIQTAFRGFLARRALRALRGISRLKSLVEGQSVKRQAANALRCMQTLSRVQSQIHARRIRMAEENQALQRQLQLKQEKEIETLRMGETWDDSTRSKEQLEAKLHNKQEAAMRRERALAYAYTHQSRKNLKNSNPTFMDPNNPQWGWSWLERWMAARPWEARSVCEKELSDQGSLKGLRALSVAGEINRTSSLEDHNGEGNKPSPSARRTSLTRAPTHKPRPISTTTPGPKKVKPGSPEGKGCGGSEDGSMRAHSDRQRRHSIGGSLDDHQSQQPKSLTKAKKKVSNVDYQKNEQKQQAKKSLSFHSSPGEARRHSLGDKMEGIPPVKDIPIDTDKMLV